MEQLCKLSYLYQEDVLTLAPYVTYITGYVFPLLAGWDQVIGGGGF